MRDTALQKGGKNSTMHVKHHMGFYDQILTQHKSGFKKRLLGSAYMNQ